jgi:hypothetical protein
MVSRAIGAAIVLLLFVVFVISFFTHTEIDRTITLAFLTVASGLLGIPSGWQLVKRNGGPPK